MNNWVKKNYCHSFSSGQQFMINPSAWLFKYGFGKRQPTNSAMQRGKTSEFVTYYLMQRESKFKEHKTVEDITDWHFKRNKYAYNQDEVFNSIEIAKQFKKALQDRQLTQIQDYQDKRFVEGKEYGLEYPIVSYTDFGFKDLIVDTKATLRCPSKPSLSHVRQQCLYSKLYNKKTSILYATPKKYFYADIMQGEVEQGFNECITVFKNIENYLKICDTIEKAVMITPLNTDDYYFNTKQKEEATKQWQTIINKK